MLEHADPIYFMLLIFSLIIIQGKKQAPRQFFCLFISSDFGLAREEDAQWSLQPEVVHGSMPVRTALTRLHYL